MRQCHVAPDQTHAARSAERKADSQHMLGFSLIEIMIALAILAIAVSVVIPGAVDMVARFERLTERRLAEDAVNNCRLAAVTSETVIVYGERAQGTSMESEIGTCGVLPNGWRTQTETDLIFSPAAVCSGSSLVLTDPEGARYLYNLDQASCRITAGTI